MAWIESETKNLPRPTRPVGFPHPPHIGCLRGAKRDDLEPSGVQSRTVPGRPIMTYRSVSLAGPMASKPQLLDHLTRVLVLRELPSLDHVPHRLAGRCVGNDNIERKASPQRHLLVEQSYGIAGRETEFIKHSLNVGFELGFNPRLDRFCLCHDSFPANNTVPHSGNDDKQVKDCGSLSQTLPAARACSFAVSLPRSAGGVVNRERGS